jgi:hypothetical protein
MLNIGTSLISTEANFSVPCVCNKEVLLYFLLENEEKLLSSTPSNGKRKFQRIKKVDDSDEEPEPTGDI